MRTRARVGLNARVLIFGFGPGKAQDLGEVAPAVCPYCHNEVFLHHVRSKKAVRLYFVPVVPYGTDDYLLCPICTRGLQLSGPQVTAAGSMQLTTQSWRAGHLDQPAYDARVHAFWVSVGVHPDGRQIVQPAPERPAGPPPGPPPRPTAPAPRPTSPGSPSRPAAARPPAPRPGPPPRPASAPAPAASPGGVDPTAMPLWLTQLDQIDQLHRDGILTDERYEEAKRRVLRPDPEPGS